MSSNVSVRLKNVSKSFQGKLVIDSISCEFLKNEVHVILGKSGTGKSVLLKMITRKLDQYHPDSGTIIVDGREMEDYGLTNDCKMLYIFQNDALLHSLSVLDNVTIYHDYHNIDDKELRVSKALRILNELGIRDSANKRISELSGGMRQRVAIARSLIIEPNILLYDEPTSALDPINTKTVSEIIKKLKLKKNITQIVVTHDVAFAYSIADTISILDDGKISITGDVDTIKASNNPLLEPI